MLAEHDIQTDARHRLKEQFTLRVVAEARTLLEIWQRTNNDLWSAEKSELALGAAQRMQSAARRAGLDEQEAIAIRLVTCLTHVADNKHRLHNQAIRELYTLMHELCESGVRKHDHDAGGFVIPALRGSVLIGLQDTQLAIELKKQLSFLGIDAIAFSESSSLIETAAKRHTLGCILDVNFGSPHDGIQLAEELHIALERTLPIVFYSQTEPDNVIRFKAAVAGGEAFFVGDLDTSRLIDILSRFSRTTLKEPYRVLIVEDSKAQLFYLEQMLHSAGILTHGVSNPEETISRIMEFEPDLVLLDMYMPQYSGMVVAKAIRQSEQLDSLPIVYLSAESDLDKQLEAMSHGGDDFITKPATRNHLVLTVRNRIARAHSLKARIVRDSLTGLFTHSYTQNLLNSALEHAHVSDAPVSFVMVDIDHFKHVNDTYGHPAGDRIIKTLALCLRQRLRRSDAVGRYGGEEFALILPNTDCNGAMTVVEQLRDMFSRITYTIDGVNFSCTFSAGIAQSVSEISMAELIERADKALYQAKRNGRNQVCVFPSERVFMGDLG